MVLTAEDLKRDAGFRKMSVYCVLWIDPAMKQSTRVHHKGGRYPEWNDVLVFNLGEDVSLFPHSVITIQVFSQGKRKQKLLGTTFLPFAEIARIKAMRDDPEEHDCVQLQLTTPSGQAQGYLSLSISLIDRSEAFSTSAFLSLHPSSLPVMGYPVGSPIDMAHHSTPQFPSAPPEMHHQVTSSTYQASSNGLNFSGPTQPAEAVPYYPHNLEGGSTYIETPLPYHPFMDRRPAQQTAGKIALALLGGAISGFVIGDILGVVF